jgi:general stress protein YciG
MANSKSNRGLASANEETRRRVAKAGGQAAQASGRAHRLTTEERRRGGRNSPGNFAHRSQAEIKSIAHKGGLASHGR